MNIVKFERILRKQGYQPKHGKRHRCWVKEGHVIRLHKGNKLDSNTENRMRRDLRRVLNV